MSEKDISLQPEVQEQLRRLARDEAQNYILHSGILNEFQNIIKTRYDSTANEIAIEGKTNAYIVLGSDRDAGRGSGYGGKADTACAAIDLCAGAQGEYPQDKIPVGKSFQQDSARVYITQKADIDTYLNIKQFSAVAGNTKIKLEDSTGRSAVASKADEIRLLARNNVKICTQHAGKPTDKNLILRGGVQIIAGADIITEENKLQPMVKGDNLLECLQTIVNEVQKLQSTFADFVDEQSEINNKFAQHIHQIDTGTLITDVMVQPVSNIKIQKKIIPQIIKNGIDYQKALAKYFSVASSKYINSKFNKVN